MAKKQRPTTPRQAPNTGNEDIPPGARPAAHRRQDGVRGSSLGDRHAQGTPAGGSAAGGLGGTNVGSGDPDELDLDALQASGPAEELELEREEREEEEKSLGTDHLEGTPREKL
jgi:hypothetical protein